MEKLKAKNKFVNSLQKQKVYFSLLLPILVFSQLISVTLCNLQDVRKIEIYFFLRKENLNTKLLSM